jgi:hypothetical protein
MIMNINLRDYYVYIEEPITEENSQQAKKYKLEGSGYSLEAAPIDFEVKITRLQPLFEVNNFLDYHFNHKATGKETDWMKITKGLIRAINFKTDGRKTQVEEWIKSKEEEIKVATGFASSKNKKKAKPRLQQKHLVLLAQVILQSNDHIKSEDTNETEIAHALYLLSGYSNNSIYNDLMDIPKGRITFTKQDKSRLEVALSNLIDELKKIPSVE